MRKIEWSSELWTVMPSGCWEWSGVLTDHGYGQFGRAKKAHREAKERELGRTLSSDEKVRHSCDNPPCVNPSHLLVGTQKENISDMMERGRAWHSNYTHCSQGHELSGDNLAPRSDTGKPRCRICVNQRAREYYQRKKAKA